jgi:hypothetical protein
MAIQDMTAKIPKQSILYLGTCLTGVLLFVLLGILPSGSALNALDQAIQDKKFAIEEQKALLPLHEALKGRVQTKRPESLPMPAPGKLETDKINTIPQTMRQIAAGNRLRMLAVVPDLAAMAEEGRRLPVEVSVSGEFADFRQFLIDLNALPYIEGTREILIEQGQQGQTFKLKFFIAVM